MEGDVTELVIEVVPVFYGRCGVETHLKVKLIDKAL